MTNIFIFGLMILLIASLGLLVWLYQKNHQLVKRLKELTDPETDWAAKQAQDLINSASQKADTILSQAEIDSLKMSTAKSIEMKMFESEVAEKMDKLVASLAASLTASLDRLEGQVNNSFLDSSNNYRQFLTKSQHDLTKSEAAIEESMQIKVNELLFKFEQNLAGFLSSSEQKSFDAINLELRSARQLIESYKSQQLALLDENIVAVLERTLDLVLKEKLSLRNQLDLVYQSLERAKAEKLI